MLSVSLLRPVFGTGSLATRLLSTSVSRSRKVLDPTLPVVPKVANNNPYPIFFKEYLATNGNIYRDASGKLNVKDVAVAAGSAFNALPQAERDVLQKRASDERKRTAEEYRQFWVSTSKDTKSAIEQATGKMLKYPGGKKAEKEDYKARSGNPGKPLNPYLAFAKTVRSELLAQVDADLPPMQRSQAVAKLSGAKWLGLSDAEKEVYKSKHKEQRAIYDAWAETQTDLKKATPKKRRSTSATKE
ncbi:hypothetical protein B9479_000543 [Cryptococcus floricola]|uniref:HMG box domain-containing protein n=1 Tax=Cryptococcus floricola TaxID=2591691 RepID=A0A5D3B4R3_9TREE|nr:hypothetical protein B9479_000543 [Cryptococcus floricola]